MSQSHSPHLEHPALTLTKTLIEAESVTPEDAGCQTLIADRLRPLGFAIEPLPFSDAQGSVSNLWARRGDTKPCVVLAGHTDVVPPGNLLEWATPPFKPVEKNAELIGRGAADMKASLAAFVIAVERFVAQHPNHPGSIAFLLTSDEEGPATCGTRKVIETLQARNEHFEYCLIGEPSSTRQLGDVIKNGRRGSLGGKLTVIGDQGHIAYPHLAHNPIHDCGRVISALCEIEWDQGNDYFPPTSFQISNIHSGTGASNVIPGVAEITFNLRFSTEITAQQIEQRVEQCLSQLGIRYQMDWVLYGEPFLTEEGTLVSACRAAVEQELGIRPELSTSGGTSDGRFIAPIGAEVVELGPINATIHQCNERIPLNTPEQLSRVYEAVLEHLLLK